MHDCQQPLTVLRAPRRVFKETGKLLVAFIIGAFATVVGTVVAFKMVPLTALGASDSWKIASALAARHIGGAINYVAVAETLQVCTPVCEVSIWFFCVTPCE